jgi:hypothetical protein
LCRSRCGRNNDFNVLIVFHQEAQEPFNRELPELSAQHLGYGGLAHTEQRGGFGLFHVALAAPDFMAFLVAHGFSSLAIRSASRSSVQSAQYRGAARMVRIFIWQIAGWGIVDAAHYSGKKTVLSPLIPQKNVSQHPQFCSKRSRNSGKGALPKESYSFWAVAAKSVIAVVR